MSLIEIPSPSGGQPFRYKTKSHRGRCCYPTPEKNARSPVVQFSPSYRAVRSFPLLIMEVPLAQNLALTRTNGEPSCQTWFLDSKAPPLVPVIALLIPPPAVDGHLATFNK